MVGETLGTKVSNEPNTSVGWPNSALGFGVQGTHCTKLRSN